jgi:hypothetical protein
MRQDMVVVVRVLLWVRRFSVLLYSGVCVVMSGDGCLLSLAEARVLPFFFLLSLVCARRPSDCWTPLR